MSQTRHRHLGARNFHCSPGAQLFASKAIDSEFYTIGNPKGQSEIRAAGIICIFLIIFAILLDFRDRVRK